MIGFVQRSVAVWAEVNTVTASGARSAGAGHHLVARYSIMCTEQQPQCSHSFTGDGMGYTQWDGLTQSVVTVVSVTTTGMSTLDTGGECHQ